MMALSYETIVGRLHWQLAALRFQLAWARYAAEQKALHHSNLQPRVAAGNLDGGQWTEGGRGVGQFQRRRPSGNRFASDITGFTRHGINQAINRGVSPTSILDAINRPLQIRPQPNGTTRYIGLNAVVVLDPSGRVITVWGR